MKTEIEIQPASSPDLFTNSFFYWGSQHDVLYSGGTCRGLEELKTAKIQRTYHPLTKFDSPNKSVSKIVFLFGSQQ